MLARIDRIALRALACLLPCLLSCFALAQTPQWPTAQDIDRALKANPFPDADRIGSQPIPRPPRVDPQRGAIDIEALARGKTPLPNAGGSSGAAPTPLRIFITLDMPRASLQLLTDQAARAGAVLVLRGLKSQSMRQTVAVVQELIGKRRVAWVIDPEAFTRFAVRQAPTFVLTLNDAANDAQRGCNAGCATPASFVSVAGDVSLDYALETIQRRQPQAAPRAEPLLKRLRGS
ncbi:type-F conjugative transfer system pilin assembly protein TrbC [Sulfuritalea sp.]|uniref:type-F conjugative transfer system pilin assembly protein TrbC n=1 Tax=Sulfuritalea sp. TaxID=2480090 RepID=UPI001AC21D69|nr:type-F conjugative transfer system pilin assembly protein TrbC [Sulfuritalea sp.]MBN8477002.1 type-F conjugative transfer system pilin assembly protein TrbC [Sulfuritalea sp.]